jgi:hypothetical protein
MEVLELVSSVKMHRSARGIKAFEGKLSIIEAVELKFTSVFAHSPAQEPQRIGTFRLSKVLVPMEAAFRPFWVKLLLTLPQIGSNLVWQITTGQTFCSSLA